MATARMGIQIDDGTLEIVVNSDPSRIIVFNPRDVVFAERFYALQGEFESKLLEYKLRHAQLDLEKNNIKQRIQLLRESCEYMRGRIDYLFGDGTSKAAFGDAMTLDMFTQFFTQITPYISRARTAAVEKHVMVKKHSRVMGRK